MMRDAIGLFSLHILQYHLLLYHRTAYNPDNVVAATVITDQSRINTGGGAGSVESSKPLDFPPRPCLAREMGNVIEYYLWISD